MSVKPAPVTEPVTAEQAMAALDAILGQFATHIAAGGPPPAAVAQYDGTPHWAILWVDGPLDWAHSAFVGGVDEEVAAELGDFPGVPAETAAAAATIAAVPVPEGVFAEPITGSVLGLYPDGHR